MSDVNLFVEIGNSDDKLPQERWSLFVHWMQTTVETYSTKILGVYFSAPEARWQNACWHFTIKGKDFNELEKRIGGIATKFDQQAIALTQGDTVFVTKEGKEAAYNDGEKI